MRILTFNWHEAYICLLAKTGHQWHIIERLKGGVKHWLYQVRPLPSNATLVDEQTAMEKLNRGGYDLVVCHNVKDLMQVQASSVPKIMVFHNKLSTEIALGGNQVNRDKYLNDLRNLLDNIPHLHLVFVSESKRADWGLPGQVITPGIGLDEYRGYEGTEPKVLRVGNFIKERDIMMGFSAQEQILFGIPSTLLGLNPTVPGAKISNSWEDLKQHYRSHRVYLNTTVEGWEDGYNLAMLEAMATGMPVVSTANSTSPVVDGYNGYISDDLKYLREKILYLLEDREEAVRLGKNARKTVEERFNINDFVAKWREVMEGAAVIPASRWGGCPYVRGTTTGNGGKNILLAYVSYPATTARYLEDSLRKTHNVVTVGPSIWPGLIRKWNLENMGEEVKPHDIPCGFDIDIRQVVEELSPAWHPDLLLWVESVYGYLPKGIGQLPFPTACYLIDSHLHLREHLKWAEGFNFIFVAQRQYIPEFERAGFKNVYWLPLACDPQVHRKFDVKKAYEIGFAGSLTPEHRERRRLLTLLCQQFNVHIDRKFFHEMALLFSRSKIVFNHSVRNDLNMRVFEALCCGSMLLTDEATGSGLSELFLDRQHLVIYRNRQELVELARYYLEHPEEREEIARKGREEALAKHTFDHRVEQVIKTIFEGAEHSKRPKGRYTGSVVSIIVPVYNQLEYTKLCVESIQRYTSFPYELIFVDNGSTDGTDKYLKTIPKAKIITNSTNYGFAKACNQGIRIASGDYILLLNNDVVVTEGWLRRMVRCAESDSKIGLVGPVSNYVGSSNQLDQAAKYSTLEEMGQYAEQIAEKNKGHWVEMPDSDRLVGFCLLIKREVIDTIGLLDERFVLGFFEDDDYCMRAREAGYKLMIAKDVFIHHFGSRTFKGNNIDVRAVGIHNRKLFNNKWKVKQLLKERRDLEESSDLNSAIARYKDALDTDPESMAALFGLVKTSFELNQLEVAEKYLNRYLELHPANLDVLFSLGGVYVKQGKYREANKVLERVLLFDPGYKDAKEVLKMVKGRKKRVNKQKG